MKERQREVSHIGKETNKRKDFERKKGEKKGFMCRERQKILEERERKRVEEFENERK